MLRCYSGNGAALQGTVRWSNSLSLGHTWAGLEGKQLLPCRNFCAGSSAAVWQQSDWRESQGNAELCVRQMGKSIPSFYIAKLQLGKAETGAQELLSEA